MNYPAVGTPERRERDLEMIRNPGTWPLRKLPMKRILSDDPNEARFGTIEEADVRWDVYRIYAPSRTGGEPVALTYSSWEALLEDGWAID